MGIRFDDLQGIAKTITWKHYCATISGVIFFILILLSSLFFLHAAERHYSAADRYGAAKLANILFTKELNRRCAEQGKHIVSVAVHPGLVYGTKLARYSGFAETISSIGQLLSKQGAFSKIVFNEPVKNTKQGI